MKPEAVEFEKHTMEINGNLFLMRRTVIKLFCFAFDHPLVFGIASFVIFLNRFFPSLSGFLISSCPVIGCTLLFLWLPLTSGPYDVSKREEELGKKKQDCFCSCPLNCRNEREVDDIRISRRKVIFPGDSGRELGKDLILLCSCSATLHKMRVVEDGEGDLVQISSEPAGDACDLCEVYDLDDGSTEDDQRLQDVISMVDEIHPVLDCEINQTDSSSSNDSDSQSLKSENQENDELEEDQKNLKDVGVSEMEMKQKLEHLITRRRSRKYQRSETDKSLIAFDTSNPAAVVEELSRLLLLIPPRSTDHSDTQEEFSGLIPGSAPSVISTGNQLHHSSGNEAVNGNSSHQSQDHTTSQPKVAVEEEDDDDEEEEEEDEEEEEEVSSSSKREVIKKHWISVRSRMSYAMRQLMAEERSGSSNTSSNADESMAED